MTALLRLLVAAALAATGGLGVAACGDDGAPPKLEVSDADSKDQPADYEYLIPYGTQRRIASGEDIEIMPERLEVKVGESIKITNDDSEGAFVGIFYVGAGETVRMTFTTPGELSGKCEVSSSGEFTIDVQDA